MSIANFDRKRRGLQFSFQRVALVDRVESELQDLLSLVVVIPEVAIESRVEDVHAGHGG